MEDMGTDLSRWSTSAKLPHGSEEPDRTLLATAKCLRLLGQSERVDSE
jgi:hypothetical protein